MLHLPKELNHIYKKHLKGINNFSLIWLRVSMNHFNLSNLETNKINLWLQM